MTMRELSTLIKPGEFARRESWPLDQRIEFCGSGLFWNRETEMWGLQEQVFQVPDDIAAEQLDPYADDWVVVKKLWRVV